MALCGPGVGCAQPGGNLRETFSDHLVEVVPTLPARCYHIPPFLVLKYFLAPAVLFFICWCVLYLRALLSAYYVPAKGVGPGETEAKEQMSCLPGAYGLVMIVMVGRQTITRISKKMWCTNICYRGKGSRQRGDMEEGWVIF